MKLFSVLFLTLFSLTANAAITYTPGPAKIYTVGTGKFMGNYGACDVGVQAQAVANGKTIKFRCVQITTAKGSANPPPPPPPPPTCTAPQPPNESRAGSCPAGTTGSWTQTRSYAAVAYPTCWSPGPWQPANPPAGTCVGNPPPPPPPPPPPGNLLAKLLNFAETWDRNWNFGGHTVTSQFGEDQGRWDYTESTYEPWLFDRPAVGYKLYELTGDSRWRTKFLSDFAYYRAHIDSQGIFTPKGADDTKYGYVEPFYFYELATADQQYRPVAKRIYDSWIREWSTSFQPGPGSDQLWTEREIAFALEAALFYHRLTGDAAALNRAQALVQQWKTAAGSVGAPLITYTQHEGGGPGGTTPQNKTSSPWMSALYFQALRQYYALTSDPEALSQVSKYADYCEQPYAAQGTDRNCYYDAAKAHVQYSGLIFVRYLTGELIGDAGYDYGNMGHCLDQRGLLKFALFAKQQRGESLTATQNRYAQMGACADQDFVEWERDTDYLPRYRVNPARKFNWQLRGYYEDAQ